MTPAQAIEANRIKDEAHDDALLEGWMPVAEAALAEYRGNRLAVPMPGCEPREPAEGLWPPVEGVPSVRLVDRFARLVRERFEAEGWWAEPIDRIWSENMGSARIPAPMAMAFMSLEDHARIESGQYEWNPPVWLSRREKRAGTRADS